MPYDKYVKRKFVIYGMFDPRNGELRYVGKTNRPYDRFYEHTRKRDVSKNTYVAKWIRNLLSDGLKPFFSIIHELPTHEALIEAEIYWIAYFRTLGCRLTNSSAGGIGPIGVNPSAETREKLAATQRGRKASPELRAKLSFIHKERLKDPAALEAATAALLKARAVIYPRPVSKLIGIPRPKHVMEKMRATIKRLNKDPVWVAARRKKMGCKSFVDHLGNRYETTSEASNKLGLNGGSIHHVLTGKVRQTGGYTFRYTETS